MPDEDIYQVLQARLTIDKLRLDAELIAQPALVCDAHEHLAGALLTRDQCEADCSFAKAVAADKLRGEECAGKKRSETQIASEIALDKDYKQALARLDDGKLAVNLWSGLVKALEQRGRTLDKLANLITSGFLTTDAIYDERRRQIRQVSVEKRTLNRDEGHA